VAEACRYAIIFTFLITFFYGSINVFASVGGAIGSPVVAAVFDILGTYKPAWVVLAVIMFINVILVNLMFKAKDKYEKTNP